MMVWEQRMLADPDLDALLNILSAVFGGLLLANSIAYLVISSQERRKLLGNVQSAFIAHEYQTAYDYTNSRLGKFWTFANELVARQALVIACFYLNNLQEAEDVIYKTKWKQQSKNMLIYKYLLLLSQHRVEEARNLLTTFQTFVYEPLLSDRILATELMRTVDTGHVEPRIYAGAQFPALKEILDYYGRDIPDDLKKEDDNNDASFSSSVELE